MLSVMNDLNNQPTPVDWWFIYKLPHGCVEKDVDGSAGSNADPKYSGFNYLYFDPDGTSGLKLSEHVLGSGTGALHNTLDAIFTAAEKPRSEVGWLLYNDEVPYTRKREKTRGHCKGVLAFDRQNDSGIWILHSTPRYPITRNPTFPQDERIYAQSFIGITLDSYDTACMIASQLHAQQQPQVYGYKLPDSVANGNEQDDIYRLCCGAEPHPGALTSHISFKSRGGTMFQSIAKNRHWGKDFWIDLVGPALKADLQVESWRRGKIPGDEDLGDKLDVVDVGGIDLSALGTPVSWPYTRDHAKWATSQEDPSATLPGWVCVADINRQVSQEKRGGGSVCFRQHELWHALSSIEVMGTGRT